MFATRLFLILGSISLLSSSFAYRRVCYYSSWAIYNEGGGHFEPEYLDPFLCTHVVYAFVGINRNGDIELMDEWGDIGDEWTEGQIPRLNRLKRQNPNLKTMVAAGGWNFGTEIFSIVANDAQKRQNFANSAAAFCKRYNFDGFDIDWEYPVIGDGARPSDKQAFTELIKVFRQRFDQDGLLVSAATSSAVGSVSVSYDIPALTQYLDFVNIMTYDLHGSWDPITGHNAPLHFGSYLNNIPGSDHTLHVEAIIDNFLAKGANPQKLNLGVPFYARTFTLRNANDNGFGAAISGPGRPGTFYSEAGNLAFNEICAEQTQNLWRETFDDEQGVPYAVKQDQWAGYDNARSLALKADFLKSRNLGGVMVWSIETDDFAGTCGPKWPLMNTLKNALP